MGFIPKHSTCVLVLLVAGCGSETTDTRSQHVLSADEIRVVEWTNRVRIEESLQPLNVNQELCLVARAQAGRLAQEKMARLPNREALANELAAAGYRFSIWGVNVAESSKGVDDAFIGIINRGRSEVEILQPKYEDVGVGIARDESNALYVVQVFGSKRKQ